MKSPNETQMLDPAKSNHASQSPLLCLPLDRPV